MNPFTFLDNLIKEREKWLKQTKNIPNTAKVYTKQ